MSNPTTTFRSAGLRGLENLVRKLGGDPQVFLKKYKISSNELENEENLIPALESCLMLEEIATVINCPDFSLRLSRYWDLTILGPLALALQHSPSLEEALEFFSRYMFIHSPAIAISTFPKSDLLPNSAEIRIEILMSEVSNLRQPIDACLAGLYLFTKALTQENFQLDAVSLPHEPQAPISAYRQHFGAPIRTSQSHAALFIPISLLKSPLNSTNEMLYKIATSYLVTHFPKPEQTLNSKVRHIINCSLGVAIIDKSRVAAMVNLHPRTLQRRLAEEDTSFEKILDQLQCDKAFRYLSSTNIPLLQVAELIGLTHQSSLTRSCKRWFSKTPLEIRRQATE